MTTSKISFVLMFLLGYLCSLLGTELIVLIGDGHRWAATGFDFLVMMAAAMSYQVWHNERYDFRLLVIEAVGSAIATFMVLS